jgi:hypothetical protein
MSYDINQSQGPYFDGKNQLPGQPPLDQPISPDQVNLVPDDPTMKKYSSHYEFPLSMLMAVMLHVFAVLLVLAYMAIKFYFAPPPPPDMDTIVFAGGGGQGDDSPEELRPEVKDEIVVKLDPITTEVIPDRLPDKTLFEREVQKLRQGDKGQGGEGSGGGKGKGVGTGIGDGAGPGVAKGNRLGRPRRWTIKMSYEDAEAFLEKLSELKIVIGARKPDGRFLIFQDMPTKPPVPFVEMDLKKFQEFAQKMQQIWFVSNSRQTCNTFAEGVGLSERPRTVFMFIPKDMEEAILQKELKHHGLSEEEIKKRKITTEFDVRRTGSGWEVKVLKVGHDPSLNYDDL